jgi:SnoaL-like domain
MAVQANMSEPNANQPEPGHESVSVSVSVPVVEAFFQSHDASHFAENAEWVDTAQGTTAHGRTQIADAIRRWYTEDFCEARDEPLNLIVTDDTVVAEWIFHGKPRYGFACDTAEISMSIVAVFEVCEHAIQRVRLYYDLAKRASHLHTSL